MPTARQDLIVIGIGSLLRGDDRVGLELVSRVGAHFGADLACLEVHEPEITLCETIATFEELLVVDAMEGLGDAPYRLVSLSPSTRLVPSGGLTSHVFDWGVILALSHQLFGAHTRGSLLGVSAHEFAFSEELSPQCRQAAEAASSFLVKYCADAD